jgi:RhtB (resistance to homoserine/threonine) family protein
MEKSILGFLFISIVVIVTPGPDTALTIRNVFAGGRRAGFATALGVATGQLVWALFTSLGLVALLLASTPVFHALRLLGAAYLVYLGVQSLRSSFTVTAGVSPRSCRSSGRPLPLQRAFRQGLINDLANPKMAIFFASVLPQFAQPGHGMFAQLTVLGSVFAALTLTWLSLYSVVLSLASEWLQGSAVRRTIDGVAGVALLGLGVRVAAAEE